MGLPEHSRLFFESNRRQLRALKEYIRQGRIVDALQRAHSIEGAALLINASDIAAAIIRLSNALEKNNVQAALDYADRIRPMLARFAQ